MTKSVQSVNGNKGETAPHFAVREALTSPALPEVVVRVSNLCKSFGGQRILNNASVQLRKGQIVLLRGANGAGKTTLLDILTGNLDADSGTIETSVNAKKERFHFPARWWANLNPFNHFTSERLAQEGIGRVWQDVRLFKSLTLRDNIAVAKSGQVGENPAFALFRRQDWRRQEKHLLAESESMLSRLGLSGRGTSSADMISLGQAKRVAIACAVNAGAKVLFLDEPLSGLDMRGMYEVLTLLKELSSSGDVTIVIVEHVFNIPHILNIATAVWTLRDGRLITEAPNAVHAEVSELEVSSFEKLLDQFQENRADAVHTRLERQAVISAFASLDVTNEAVPVLEVIDLVVHRGKRLVIGEEGADGIARGISFKIHKKQVSVLQAPNGWGKSTLLDAIAGFLPITSGQILVNGKSIERLSTCQRARLGLSVLRSRDNSFPTLTVKEVLYMYGVASVPAHLEHISDKIVSDLSGGQRQRVFSYGALKQNNSSIALLDEPFSALDPDRVQELTTLMLQSSEHTAMLIVVPAVLKSTVNEH